MSDNSTVYLPTDVARELAFAAGYHPGSYQAAVLMGARTDDGAVAIRAYTDLSTLDGPFIFLRDLLSDWEATHRRASRLAADLEVMGWISMWPAHSALLGTIETMVHRTFFNLPHHVSICVDPNTGAIAAYQADDSGEPQPVSLMLGNGVDAKPLHQIPVTLPNDADASP